MQPGDILSFFMLLNSSLLPMVMYLVYKMYDVSTTLGEITRHNQYSDKNLDNLNNRIDSIEKTVNNHTLKISSLEEKVERYVKYG